MLALASCSSDNDTIQDDSRTVTLDIPVEIYSSNNEVTSRAASQGDPGTSAEFKAPRYLYIYAFVKDKSTAGYELLTKTITYKDDTEASSNWTMQNEGESNERWQKKERVTFKLSAEFDDQAELGSSRVYAIASRDDLSKLLTDDVVKTFTKLDSFKTTTIDLKSFSSDQLKDLYSTPYNDQSSPAQSTDNGLIVSSTDGKSLTCSPVKLYHVAAKVDFTWQVATDKQDSVEVASITCTGVPTTCKVFVPTDNPTTDTTSCLVLGTTSESAKPVNEVNTGNKWLGRAYAYMLQPSSGAISYTVTYGGKANKQSTTNTFTPSSLNKVFTGWYRVVANVK